MKLSPIVLLLFAVFGCDSGTESANPSAESGGNQDQQQKDATPAKRAEKTLTEKAPDSTAIKKHMTPAQLDLGDPIVNSVGMVLVPIPSGEFQMGSPDFDKDAQDNEKPRHLVKITKPFYLSAFEVTQQQYEKVMGDRPWQGEDFVTDGPDYPATNMRWKEAVDFCRKLSEQEGVEYRLPTEAEWEYACRAGTNTVYSFGDDVSKLGQHAWYDKNGWNAGKQHAQPAGQKLPNTWGLYDMHGNVLELCQDLFTPYGEENVQNDPTDPAQFKGNSLRGGAFLLSPEFARSASRTYIHPFKRTFNVGFRPVRTYNSSLR